MSTVLLFYIIFISPYVKDVYRKRLRSNAIMILDCSWAVEIQNRRWEEIFFELKSVEKFESWGKIVLKRS